MASGGSVGLLTLSEVEGQACEKPSISTAFSRGLLVFQGVGASESV